MMYNTNKKLSSKPRPFQFGSPESARNDFGRGLGLGGTPFPQGLEFAAITVLEEIAIQTAGCYGGDAGALRSTREDDQMSSNGTRFSREVIITEVTVLTEPCLHRVAGEWNISAPTPRSFEGILVTVLHVDHRAGTVEPQYNPQRLKEITESLRNETSLFFGEIPSSLLARHLV
eukprot:2168186-Rhodomonas_salina.2